MYRNKSRIFQSILVCFVMFFAGVSSFGAIQMYQAYAALSAHEQAFNVAFAGSMDKTPSGGTIYKVSTPAHLLAMSTYFTAPDSETDRVFKMTNDIDMSDVSSFLPIGNSANPFFNDFIGDGYVVKNLNLTNKHRDGASGLFGHTKGNKIFGVGMEGFSAAHTYNGGVFRAGGLVGNSNGSIIQECYVQGSGISKSNNGGATSYIGGIVGYANGGKVYNCYSDIAVSNTGTSSSAQYAGGVIGYVTGSLVSSGSKLTESSATYASTVSSSSYIPSGCGYYKQESYTTYCDGIYIDPYTCHRQKTTCTTTMVPGWCENPSSSGYPKMFPCEKPHETCKTEQESYTCYLSRPCPGHQETRDVFVSSSCPLSYTGISGVTTGNEPADSSNYYLNGSATGGRVNSAQSTNVNNVSMQSTDAQNLTNIIVQNVVVNGSATANTSYTVSGSYQTCTTVPKTCYPMVPVYRCLPVYIDGPFGDKILIGYECYECVTCAPVPDYNSPYDCPQKVCETHYYSDTYGSGHAGAVMGNQKGDDSAYYDSSKILSGSSQVNRSNKVLENNVVYSSTTSDTRYTSSCSSCGGNGTQSSSCSNCVDCSTCGGSGGRWQDGGACRACQGIGGNCKKCYGTGTEDGRYITCGICGGDGKVSGTSSWTCSRCGGWGSNTSYSGIAGRHSGNERADDTNYHDSSKILSGSGAVYTSSSGVVNMSTGLPSMTDKTKYTKLNFEPNGAWAIGNGVNGGKPYLRVFYGRDVTVGSKLEQREVNSNDLYIDKYIYTTGDGTYQVDTANGKGGRGISTAEKVTIKYQMNSAKIKADTGVDVMSLAGLGYKFSHWERDGIKIDAVSVYAFSETNDAVTFDIAAGTSGRYEAVFKYIDYSISYGVSRDNESGGYSIYSGDSQHIGAYGNNTYIHAIRSEQTYDNAYVVRADGGYRITGWQIGDEVSSLGTAKDSDNVTGTIDIAWIAKYGMDAKSLAYYVRVSRIDFALDISVEGSGASVTGVRAYAKNRGAETGTAKIYESALDEVQLYCEVPTGYRLIGWELRSGSESKTLAALNSHGYTAYRLTSEDIAKYSVGDSLKIVARVEREVNVTIEIDADAIGDAGNEAGIMSNGELKRTYLAYTGELVEMIIRVAEGYEDRFEVYDGDKLLTDFGNGITYIYPEGDVILKVVFFRQEYDLNFYIYDITNRVKYSQDGAAHTPIDAASITGKVEMSVIAESGNKYKDGMNIFATLYDTDRYKLVGVRIDDPINGTLVLQTSLSNLSYYFSINGHHDYYVIIADVSMSVLLVNRVMNNSEFNDPRPADNMLAYGNKTHDSMLTELPTSSASSPVSVRISTKARMGYTFNSIRYGDTVLVSNAAVADENGYYSYVIADFDRTKSGIYYACYDKSKYMLMSAEHEAGKYLFSTPDAYINTTISVSKEVNDISVKYRYLGYSLTENGEILSLKNNATLQITESMIAGAISGRIVIYPRYERLYQFSYSVAGTSNGLSATVYKDNVVTMRSGSYYSAGTVLRIELRIDAKLYYYQATVNGILAGERQDNVINITLAGDRELEIIFEYRKYSIELVTNDGFGDIALTGAGVYTYGDTANIGMEADPSAKLVMWEQSTDDEYRYLTSQAGFGIRVAGDVVYRATFVKLYTVTTEVKDGIGGAVDNIPTKISAGSERIIRSSPNAGWQVAGWEIDGVRSDALNGQKSLSIVVNSDVKYTVIFEKIKYSFSFDGIDGVLTYIVRDSIDNDVTNAQHEYDDELTLIITGGVRPLVLSALYINGVIIPANSTSGAFPYEYSITVNARNFVNNICEISSKVVYIYSITVEKEAGYEVSPDITVSAVGIAQTDNIYTVLEGRSVYLRATQNDLFRFINFEYRYTGDGQWLVMQDTANFQNNFVVTSNVYIRPRYNKVSYFVYINNKDTENINSDIIHAATTAITINDVEGSVIQYGDKVSLSPGFTPVGYVFAYYVDELGNTYETNNYSFVMNKAGNRTLTVVYKRSDYSVTVKDIMLDGQPLNGASHTGGGVYRVGDNVVIRANIPNGYTISDWKINGTELVFVDDCAEYSNMKVYRYTSGLAFGLLPSAEDMSYLVEAIVAYTDYEVKLELINNFIESGVATATVKSGAAGSETGSGDTKSNVHIGDRVILEIVFSDAGAITHRLSGVLANNAFVGGWIVSGNKHTLIIDTFTVSTAKMYFGLIMAKDAILDVIIEPAIAIAKDGIIVTNDTLAVGGIVNYTIDISKMNAGYEYLGLFRRIGDTDVSLANNTQSTYRHTLTADDITNGITLVAAFRAIDYNIKIESGDGGKVYKDAFGEMIDAEGTGMYNALDGLMLVFAGNVGYDLSKVTIGGVDITSLIGSGDYCIYVVDFMYISEAIGIPVVISAEYQLKTFTLTVIVMEEGNVLESPYTNVTVEVDNVDEDGRYTYGSNIGINVSFTQEGYKIDAIHDRGVEIQYSAAGMTMINVQNDATFTITYSRKLYNIDLTSNNAAYGYVSGSGAYRLGDNVSFQAIGMQGYSFDGYYKADGSVLSREPSYTFVFELRSEGSYEARFLAQQVAINANAYYIDSNNDAVLKPMLDSNNRPINGARINTSSDAITVSYGEHINTSSDAITVSYGEHIRLEANAFKGYAFNKYIIANRHVLEAKYEFDIVQTDFAAAVDGVLEIKVVYIIEKYTFKMTTNFHKSANAADNIYDQNNKVIMPASVTFRSGVIDSSYVSTIVTAPKYSYNSLISMRVNNVNSMYEFKGFYILGFKVDHSYDDNSESYMLSNYRLETNVVVEVVFSPKITFTNSVYTRQYNGNDQGINANTEVILTDALRGYLVITYDNSTTVPVHVKDSRDNGGKYVVSAYINLKGLNSFVTEEMVTLQITPIMLDLSYIGTYTRAYNGNAVAKDALKDVILDVTNVVMKDRGFIQIDKTGATANIRKNGISQAYVGSNLDLLIAAVKLVGINGMPSLLLNDYVLDGDGTALMTGIANILAKSIKVDGVSIINKVYDGNTDVIFDSNHKPVLSASDIISGDEEEITLDMSKVKYSFDSAQIGKNRIAIATTLSGSTGISGAKSGNYILILPEIKNLTIHPYILKYENVALGRFELTDVNRNLYLPVNAELQVSVVDSNTILFNDVHQAIAPMLSNKETLVSVYTFNVISNGQKVTINKTFKLKMTLPVDSNNTDVKLIQVTKPNNIVNSNPSLDGSTATLDLTSLTTMAIIASSQPVALWIIITIVAVVLLIIIALSIYLFVILPKRREKAYIKHNKIT